MKSLTDSLRCCPDCGAELPATREDALCSACLLRQAFASRTNDGAAEETSVSPPPSPEEIADKFPSFDVRRCLGRGGMGVVYQARQKSLNREVAIKILAPERVDDPRFAEIFSKEAELLAKLSHPNIVTIHDFGETGGLFYLVMEYVDGVNLRDLLQAGNLEPEQALAVVPPICEALEYAHEKGVVHRDIKPENLLLDREGRVKIADFGIAALVGAVGENSGTPPYMAPEQSGGSVDRRADIYALGVVLYEMLTGERPTVNVVAPSRKVQVDVKIDEMVLRALENEPEKRYQTAGEFRTALETVGSSFQEKALTQDDLDALAKDRSNWYWGIFYVCRRDPRIVLPKRIAGLGWTVNFANPWTLPFVAALVFGVILVLRGSEHVGLSSPNERKAVYIAILIGVVWICHRMSQSRPRTLSDGKRVDRIPSDAMSRMARWLMIASLPGTALLFAIVPGGRHHYVLIFSAVSALTSLVLALASWKTSLGRTLSIIWLSLCLLGGLMPVVYWSLIRIRPSPPGKEAKVRAWAHWPVSVAGDGLSVYAVQSEADVKFMFCYDGDFKNTSSSGVANGSDGSWTDSGSILLRNGRSFGFRRESRSPRFLEVNGIQYDLKKGRLFVILDDQMVQRNISVSPVSSDNISEIRAKVDTGILQRVTLDRANGKESKLFLDLDEGKVAAVAGEIDKSEGEGMKEARAQGLDFCVVHFEDVWLAITPNDLLLVKTQLSHSELSKMPLREIRERLEGDPGVKTGDDPKEVPGANSYVLKRLEEGPLRFIFQTNEMTRGFVEFRLGTPDAMELEVRFLEFRGASYEAEKSIAEEGRHIEETARKFMEAFSVSDVEGMMSFASLDDDFSEHEQNYLLEFSREVQARYDDDLTRLVRFSEWYREGGYAVGRIERPSNTTQDQRLCIFMGLKNGTEWRVLALAHDRHDVHLSEAITKFRKKKY